MDGSSSQASDVLRAIRRIVRRVSQHSRHLGREVGLTVPQLLCLKAVGEMELDDRVPEITAVLVGESVQLSAPTVSRILDRLVTAGLVERKRTSKDRRKVCLSLTTAGLERYQTLPEPMQDAFVARFHALGAKRQAGLLSALREVIEMMEADGLDAAPVLTPGLDVRTSDEADEFK